MSSKLTDSGQSPSGDFSLEKKKAGEAMNTRKPTDDAARDAEDACPVVQKSRDDNTLRERLERHRLGRFL